MNETEILLALNPEYCKCDMCRLYYKLDWYFKYSYKKYNIVKGVCPICFHPVWLYSHYENNLITIDKISEMYPFCQNIKICFNPKGSPSLKAEKIE